MPLRKKRPSAVDLIEPPAPADASTLQAARFGPRPNRAPQIGPLSTDPFMGAVPDHDPAIRKVPTGVVWQPFEEAPAAPVVEEIVMVAPVVERPRRRGQHIPVRKVARDISRPAPATGPPAATSVESALARQQRESLEEAQKFILSVAQQNQWPTDKKGQDSLVKVARRRCHPDVVAGSQEVWDLLHVAFAVTGLIRPQV